MKRYESRLVRLMHTIGPRRDMAEDLAQETFMRVFRARKTYEAGAKFSTRLFTIAGNVARNAARSLGETSRGQRSGRPKTTGFTKDPSSLQRQP